MGEDIRNSKILIVEDDADNVYLLELLLGSSGFTNVHATDDARNVEHLVQDLEPHLILLDLHMPHVDGLEVMRRVQEATPGRDIPMIVMSGDLTPENRRIGAEVGATDFVSKPYEMGAFLQKVEQALGASKSDAHLVGE